MKKFQNSLLLLLFMLSTGIVNAQIGPMEIEAPKKLPKQKLVATFKIKTFTYQVYERQVFESDNGGYDTGERGTDYYLYQIFKGTMVEQVKFQKQIRNNSGKISREGSYKVNGETVEISEYYYTYHFGSSGRVQIIKPGIKGRMELVSEKDLKIDAEKLSDDYVKAVEQQTIYDPR